MNIEKVLNRLEFYRNVAWETGSIQKYYKKVYTDTRLIAEEIHHTTKLEGNTVTYNDTLAFMQGILPIHEALHKYQSREVYELQGMKDALQYMYKNINTKLTEEFIKMLHYAVYNRTERADLGIYAGEFRSYPVFTDRSDTGERKYFVDSSTVELAIDDLIFYYTNSSKTLTDICNLKLDFIHIHPFGDGNGRTSRLLLNWALISNGYPPVIIKATDRKEYIATLNSYGDTGSNIAFVDFITRYILNIYKDIL